MSHSSLACIRRVMTFGMALVALSFTGLGPQRAGAATGAWTTNGPYGGIVDVIAVDPSNPDRIYEASAAGGVFRSADRGAHWTRASNGLTDPICFALAIDPKTSDTLYAGCSLGVFRSVDRGAHWTKTASLVNVRKLVIDSKTPSRLYAVVSQGPLYKSEDSGATWVSQFTQLQSQNLYSLAIDPADPKKIYVGAQGGVYRTGNGGKTWSLSAEGLGTGFIAVQYLTISPSKPSILYIRYGSGVARSSDSGRSWTQLTAAPSQFFPLAVDPTKPDVLYGTAYPGRVVVSRNSGRSFADVGPIEPGFAGNVRTVAVDPTDSTRLYAGSDHGVFASLDKGKSWREANQGLANVLVTALAVDPASPRTVFAGTQYGGLFKSTGGGDWRRIEDDYIDKVTALLIDPTDPATMYYASSFGKGVFKSTDGGGSWSNVLPFLAVASMALDPAKPSVLYATGGADMVQKSTNAGASWSPANTGLPAGLRPNSVSAFDGEALLTDASQGAFSSKNGGASWKDDSPTVPSGAPAVEPRADLVIRNFAFGVIYGRSVGQAVEKILSEVTPNPLARIGFAFAKPFEGAALTASGGWKPWYAPKGVDASECYPVGALAPDPQTPGVFYAGGRCGVMQATKNGAKVVLLGKGLPGQVPVQALAVSPAGDVVYAGLYGGGVYSLTK